MMAKKVLSDLNVDGTVTATEVTAGTHKLTEKLDATATAVRATADASGNVIASTYATKSDVGRLESSLQNFWGRLSAAEGEIDTLQGQMTTATGDITALQTRVSQAEADIGVVEDDIVTLDGLVKTKANASDVTALTGRVGTLETDVGVLESDVATLESDVAGKVDKDAIASASTLGLVKIGEGITIGTDGTISASGGGGGSGVSVFSFEDRNFDNFLIWVTSVSSYKQISGYFTGTNGFQEIMITVGGDGSTGSELYGGGLVGLRSPETTYTYYPISKCDFQTVNEDTVSATVSYMKQDGTQANITILIDRLMSTIRGSAFIIE